MSFVFEVKSKLKDSHAKLEYALQRMVTNHIRTWSEVLENSKQGIKTTPTQILPDYCSKHHHTGKDKMP